jgi:hypothetical protein
MNYEFGMDKSDPLNSGVSPTGMLKTYAADTGSMSNYNMNNDKPMDSRFEIPNNFTPARINEGFLDSQKFPLISGGDNNISDIGNPFIGKRESDLGNPFIGKRESDMGNPFIGKRESDLGNRFIGKRDFPFGKESISKPISKRKAPNFKKYFISNKCSELSNKNVIEKEANQTKFSKDQMMDVYLEDASGSKMSNSRFRIETEKED